MATRTKKRRTDSHVHRGEAFWQAAIERHRESGVSQSAFCEREGLSVSTFALWATRLRHARSALATRVEAAQFIDCTPLMRDGGQADPGLHIRLDLGGGLVLEIRRG